MSRRSLYYFGVKEVSFWVCPEKGGRISVYRNSNRPSKDSSFECRLTPSPCITHEEDEDETSTAKWESCSPEFSCKKEGERESRAGYRDRPIAHRKNNWHSGEASLKEKRELPENDRHKDHRPRISPRQVRELNKFLGDDFCHQTVFSPRVAVVFGAQSPRKYQKPEAIFIPSSKVEEQEETKKIKKPDNKGYHNRRVAMARR